MTNQLAEDRSFRERALGGGGSNPLEQLDRLFRLTAKRTWVVVAALALLVGGLLAWAVAAERVVTVQAPGMLVPESGFIEIGRLESGVVADVSVAEGATVRRGDVLLRYVGPTGEVAIIAPVDGIVQEVAIAPGSTLVPGLPALTLLPAPNRVIAVAFASPAVHAQIDIGYQVSLSAASAPAAQYGTIVGRIVDIADTPVTLSRIDRLTGGNQDLARSFLSVGPVYEVEVDLERDPTTVTGYRWTTDEGADYPVPAGTLVSMSAVIDRRSIASELLT